jgi:predicted PurR-regulated permease PerM
VIPLIVVLVIVGVGLWAAPNIVQAWRSLPSSQLGKLEEWTKRQEQTLDRMDAVMDALEKQVDSNTEQIQYIEKKVDRKLLP